MKVKTLRENPVIECPHCAKSIQIDLEQLAEAIKAQTPEFSKIRITLEKESDIMQLVEDLKSANAAVNINLRKELEKMLTKPKPAKLKEPEKFKGADEEED